MSKENKIKKTYSEDHVVAILEEIRGDFKVFGEGLENVQRGLNNLEVKVDDLTVKVDRMDIRLGSVEDRLGSVEGRLGSVEEKVDFLIEDMDEVKANIVDIKIEMKDNNGKLNKKAEKDVCDNHEKRIFKLEKTVLAA